MGHSEGEAEEAATSLLCMGHSEGGTAGTLCIGHSAGGWPEVSTESWGEGNSEMTWAAPPPPPVRALAVFWAAEMLFPITIAVGWGAGAPVALPPRTSAGSHAA